MLTPCKKKKHCIVINIRISTGSYSKLEHDDSDDAANDDGDDEDDSLAQFQSLTTEAQTEEIYKLLTKLLPVANEATNLRGSVGNMLGTKTSLLHVV